jgi:hypothetical protein
VSGVWGFLAVLEKNREGETYCAVGQAVGAIL